jgi:hypothetical protein
MNTEVVCGLRGVLDPTPEYAVAQPKLFPFAGRDYGDEWCNDQRGKIYVCPECKKERQEWLKVHTAESGTQGRGGRVDSPVP